MLRSFLVRCDAVAGAEAPCVVRLQYRGEPMDARSELLMGCFMELLDGFVMLSEGKSGDVVALGEALCMQRTPLCPLLLLTVVFDV